MYGVEISGVLGLKSEIERRWNARALPRAGAGVGEKGLFSSLPEEWLADGDWKVSDSAAEVGGLEKE